MNNMTQRLDQIHWDLTGRSLPLMSEKLSLKKRSVKIAGHGTSVSLENAFWSALKDMAEERGISVNALITEIDKERTGNLSSAIRVFVLENYRN